MNKIVIVWASAILFSMMCGSAIPVSAYAETESKDVISSADTADHSCGDSLTWTFDSAGGVLRIIGTGAMDFHGEFDAPWYNFKNKILSVSLPEGLTSIETNAFSECGNLKSVYIPDSVTEIGDCAFYECSHLAEINVPDHVLKVGEEILTDTEWFENQPEGVVYLGHIAVGCKGTIEPETVLRKGTTVLASGLFYGQTSLMSCILPEGIEEIPEECFSLCSGLKTISMPDSVKKIGSSFQSVALPADKYGVMYLGKWVIGCEKATADIELRDDTKGIAARAFEGCYELKTIKLPEGMTYIGDLAFSGSQIESLMIPDSVQFVGAGLCYGCSNLKEVRLPDSVTVLADIPITKEEKALTYGLGFFRECNSLKRIELPEHLTEIGESAFFNCNSLEEIIIPETVTKIGHAAFGWCKQLRKITILNPKCEIHDNASTIFSAFNTSSKYYYVYTGTVIGYEGSSAELFAEKYDMKFEAIIPEGEHLRGDLNGDGIVSLDDAQNCLQAYCTVLSKKPHGLDEAAFRAADIDHNGTLSPEDATFILQYYTASALSGNHVTWRQILNQYNS